MTTRNLFAIILCMAFTVTSNLQAADLISRTAKQDGCEFSILEGSTSPAPITLELTDPSGNAVSPNRLI